MKSFFGIRSPFWQIIAYLALFIFGFLTIHYRTSFENNSEPNQQLVLIFHVILVAFIALYIFSLVLHNKRNPKDKIRYGGLLPPELNTQDEGMSMYTARATRRVYIWYSFGIPVLSMLYIVFNPQPAIVIGGVAALVIGHLILYWITIWPTMKNE